MEEAVLLSAQCIFMKRIWVFTKNANKQPIRSFTCLLKYFDLLQFKTNIFCFVQQTIILERQRTKFPNRNLARQNLAKKSRRPKILQTQNLATQNLVSLNHATFKKE